MAVGQTRVLPKPPQIGSAKIVGLISDTHVPIRARRIPEEVFKIFENAEFIIHAGDLVELSVIDELEQIAPVLAVCGNMDSSGVREKLQTIDSLKLFNWKIGVIHDPGVLFGTRKMSQIAKKHGFDVLVYGHTHNSNVKWEGKTLFINPGSPTNPLPPFLVKPSVCLLRVTKEEIKPEIIQL
ncbi:MAG: metallophosphoesterase family protein [Candidatus Bathyarchaeia archaeon]